MRRNKFIALDIGTDGIRMALIDRSAADGPKLMDSGMALFQTDTSNKMAPEAVVATTLKRLLDEKKPSTRRVVIAIEGQSVFFRLVKLPRVSPEKIRRTIQCEAAQNIPFPLDEVVWDVHLADPKAAAPEMLLAAVKTDLVEGLAAAARANGLKVERMDAAPIALANAVRASEPNTKEPILLVEVRAESANLVFVDGDRTFFRSLPTSDWNEARFFQEIEQSIAFYRSRQSGNEPQRILLTGSHADIPVFSEAFGPVCAWFAPWREVQKGVSTDPSLAVAAGLAAAEPLAMNLMPNSLRAAYASQYRKRQLTASGVVLLMIGVLWIYRLNRQTSYIRAESEGVNAHIEAMSLAESKLILLEKQIARLKRSSETYVKIWKRRGFWLQTLEEIDVLLPKGIFLLVSEPLKDGVLLRGMRLSFVSYLDREPSGEDVVKRLRDTLRASSRFSEETRIFSRPSKKLFARQFVIDVYFEEAVE